VSYLLDTNVLSELKRKKPDPSVLDWFAGKPASTLYLSVLTLGELRKGIEKLADTKRRVVLNDWVETELLSFFVGRVINIDTQVADRWGQLTATTARPLPAIDSLLAATALVHGLQLVTRNLRDFKDMGVQVINPWADSITS
jgi:predicted nucleic acid-binding protein